MKAPVILINLKAYRESIGHDAQRIAVAAEEVGKDAGVTMCIAPMFMDIHPMRHHYDLEVFSQHVDPVDPGAYTGRISARALKIAGATGSLVNHSEYRQTIADIEHCVNALKTEKLTSVVCSNNVATSAALAVLGPDYIAIEPPELIGGSVSVSQANPAIITDSVEAVRKVRDDVRLLTGAGINSGQCVRTALDLGTDGVLLASNVVKAKDPEAALRNLVSLL
ncbi:MAG: triose-phosphate isomerase [Methanospirillaceae archaeon]|nr:triose-phosphate isomerase [Methanospirillaceae archaeon]